MQGWQCMKYRRRRCPWLLRRRLIANARHALRGKPRSETRLYFTFTKRVLLLLFLCHQLFW